MVHQTSVQHCSTTSCSRFTSDTHITKPMPTADRHSRATYFRAPLRLDPPERQRRTTRPDCWTPRPATRPAGQLPPRDRSDGSSRSPPPPLLLLHPHSSPSPPHTPGCHGPSHPPPQSPGQATLPVDSSVTRLLLR